MDITYMLVNLFLVQFSITLDKPIYGSQIIDVIHSSTPETYTRLISRNIYTAHVQNICYLKNYTMHKKMIDTYKSMVVCYVATRSCSLMELDFGTIGLILFRDSLDKIVLSVSYSSGRMSKDEGGYNTLFFRSDHFWTRALH